MIKVLLWNLRKRATFEGLKTYLGRWRDGCAWFLGSPGDVLSMFLVHIFVMWLSLKQVRVVFRVVTFLRLPELLNLRAVIEANIYLVLLVLITFFVWLDLAVFKLSLAALSCQLDRISATKCTKETSTSKVPETRRVPRKNPPRACKKYTRY